MNIKKKFLQLILTLIFVSSVSGGDKKVHLFPIISVGTNNSLTEKYSEILKEKLLKTGIFSVHFYKDFKYITEDDSNLRYRIKEAIKKESLDKGYSSVIYGFMTQISGGYRINIALYSPGEDNIITEFFDRIYTEEGIERSAIKCALEFASRLKSIQGSRIYVASMMMPGLGQLMMKKYLRGALFMGSFVYFVSKNFSTKSPNTVERMTFSSYLSHPDRIYTVNGRRVDYDTWNRLKTEYDDAVYSNQGLNDKKRKLQLAAGLVYIFNIIDTLILTKDYNDKRKIERKLYVSLDSHRNPSIALNFNF
ncbi:hypothetical protein ACFL4T_02095 [candidate division KSB1 bacterium]